MNLQNSLGWENWPFSTAKAGTEENRTTMSRNQQKRTKQSENLALLKHYFISSFNQSKIAHTFLNQSFYFTLYYLYYYSSKKS